MMVDPVQIEQRAELAKAASVAVGTTLGGVQIATLADFEMVSLRLARAGVAVPPHCREKAGTVFALCLQAQEWGMPIMSVLNKSYVVINKGVERIAFESQLIHAVIERNAPIKGRMRYEILGEGDERRCKVWATFKGETEPHVYVSEALAKLRDARGRNEQGVLKGSPLWDNLPEVQLFYSASRQWARLFCPDVILGAYTPEDPQWGNDAIDVTPSSDKLEALKQKLRDANKAQVGGGRGFDVDQVARDTARDTIIEGEANPGEAQIKGASDDQGSGDGTVADSGGQDGPADLGVSDRDQAGSDSAVGDDSEDGGKPAGQEGADEVGQDDQAEIFPPDRKAEKPKGGKGKR
jgi:RecT family